MINIGKKALFVVLFMVGFWIILFFQIPDNRLHVYFIDVGQGDGIFIKTPQSHQILIDGGPNNLILERLSKTMPLFDKSIDLVVLTHPHDDHIAGLLEVVKRYKVGGILLTAVNDQNPYYVELLKEVSSRKIQIFVADSSFDFEFGDVTFDTIFPLGQISGKNFKNLNNSSIAMRIKYEKYYFLLLGDLEKEVENELLYDGVDLRADIVKVAHHGSKTSSSPDFLARIKAFYAVISVGANNRFGHPTDIVLKNLRESGVKKLYRTDLSGTVEFVL